MAADHSDEPHVPGRGSLPAEAWPDHPCFAAFYGLFEKVERKRFRAIRQRLAGGAHGRVLEIGCGTGANLPYYDWTRIESLTISEPDHNMIKRAKSRLESMPSTVQAKTTLHWAPAEALELESAGYDTIVATLVFCTVHNPEAAIGEAFRLLKPGGELRLFEHVAASGLTGLLQQRVQPLYGRFSGGCQLHRPTEVTLRNAGFEVDVEERLKLSFFMPAFMGIARKPQS